MIIFLRVLLSLQSERILKRDCEDGKMGWLCFWPENNGEVANVRVLIDHFDVEELLK